MSTHIKTWQERTGNHNVRPGCIKHMLVEIAELRAALAAKTEAPKNGLLTADGLLACANCLRPHCEHNGKLCPSPNTTWWHAWDYKHAQPNFPEYAAPAPAVDVPADNMLEHACCAAASEGNKRGVKSTDALSIVAAYLNSRDLPAMTVERLDEVYAYDVPTDDGAELAYAAWFHKYGNPLPEGAVALARIVPAVQPVGEAVHIPRRALADFCQKYCLGKPELVATAESAFYAFNKAIAAPQPIMDDKSGEAIHYPECWDVAAYPTLADALSEVYHHFKCSNDDCAVTKGIAKP